MGVFLAGLASAAAIFFLLLKMDIRKMLWIDVLIDIATTGLLIWMFSGTFSGMFAACVAGVLFSMALFFVKKAIGYKRLTRRGWVDVPPSWRFS